MVWQGYKITSSESELVQFGITTMAVEDMLLCWIFINTYKLAVMQDHIVVHWQHCAAVKRISVHALKGYLTMLPIPSVIFEFTHLVDNWVRVAQAVRGSGEHCRCICSSTETIGWASWRHFHMPMRKQLLQDSQTSLYFCVRTRCSPIAQTTIVPSAAPPPPPPLKLSSFPARVATPCHTEPQAPESSVIAPVRYLIWDMVHTQPCQAAPPRFCDCSPFPSLLHSAINMEQHTTLHSNEL